MINRLFANKILFLAIIPLVLSSCATINNMMPGTDDESSSEIKEISLNKRLQISIPIPESSKYLTDKTIIFGEGSRFTGVLYLLHDIPADEVVEFYRVKMRDDGLYELTSKTDGASIGYQIEDQIGTNSWSLYHKPILLGDKQKIVARAIRLGYKASEITSN